MSICQRTQGFGMNSNGAYASAGQKGHTGVDDSCGYGSKVYALKKGIVYKILDREHPARDGSGYWAVFMVCQEPDGRYVEWQIGHLSKITCKVGDVVNPWDFIGEEGNRGIVFAGSTQITKAMQDAGDKRGSHRHYNKKFLTRRTDVINAPYLTNYSAYTPELFKDKDGFYYSVDNSNNGYAGSVDCAIDITVGRQIVDDHAKPINTPVVEKTYEKGMQLKIKFVLNNCDWTTIPQKIQEVKNFYASKFQIEADVFHTTFKNIPFAVTNTLDGSSGAELHGTAEFVHPQWYNNNITSLALAYDMVVFFVSDTDKVGHLTSAGIRADNDQGPVEITLFGGKETDHAYNQGVDMGSSFGFFAIHEIAHGIAMMFKIPDNTHKYFYTSNPKRILDDYNFSQKDYINAKVSWISKALQYILELLRR